MHCSSCFDIEVDLDSYFSDSLLVVVITVLMILVADMGG